MYEIELRFCDDHSEIRENVESFSVDLDSLALWYADLECEFFDKDLPYSNEKFVLKSFKILREY